MYQIKGYNIENNILYLDIKGSFSENTEYEIQLRLVHKDMFNIRLYQGIHIQNISSISAENTECRFDLNRIFTKYNVSNDNVSAIDFFISDGESCQKIAFPDKEISIIASNRYFDISINPFGRYFSLDLNWKNADMEAEVIFNNDSVEIVPENPDCDCLYAKRRIKSNIRYYDNCQKTDISDGRFTVPFSCFTENFNNDFSKCIWDFFIRSYIAEYGIYYFYNLKYSKPKKIIRGNLFSFITYKSRFNTLIFEIQRKISKKYIRNCVCENNSIIIELEDSFDFLELVQYENVNKYEYFNTVKRIRSDGNSAAVDISEFLDTKNFYEYRYILRISKNQHIYDVCSEDTFILSQMIQNSEFLFESDADGSMLLIKSLPQNTVPVAVFGSCMTRSAFNSKPFFNPDYKNLFSVVYSAVWPSLFSALSNPVPLNEDDYKNYDEREMPYVKREYSKTFFSEMKDSEAEYLLVDFYVDAMHGPRLTAENSFIGYKTYSRNMYHDRLIYDTERYYLDTNNYFESWKKAADSFIREITAIFPAHRIVLVTGGMTKNFIDENYNISKFSDIRREFFTYNDTMLDFREFLWGYMNSYFISALPDIKILDMQEYHYFADENHPEHMVPYHYETNYYKSFLGEFSKMVLADKLNGR